MGTNHATVFVFGGFLEIKYDSNCSLKKKKSTPQTVKLKLK